MGDPNASLALSNLSPVFLPEESSPFRTLLSEFIYVRTYSRWVDEIGRRETWDETVARYIAFLKEERPFVPADVLQAAHASIRSLETLPSMRALWSAGEAARRDNTTMYNCAFVPLDSIPAFAEVLYILMCGTGIGFSVEREFVNNLPVVAPLTGKTIPYTIADSTEGWADALKFVLTQSFLGNKVDLDYSGLRRRGAVLKTKGGRASGPEPLERLLNLCSELILSASGRQLRPIECHDIACAIGDIVHVGGFRRAALISFSDPDDEEMRHAKDWSRGSFPTIRYMANNTSFYAERPTEESFWTEWRALVASRSGERGFFRMPPAKRATRKGDYRLNPCVSARTWVQTTEGPRQVSELIGKPFTAVVDGREYPSTDMGFWKTDTKPLYRLNTVEGYSLELTEDHQVCRVVQTARAQRCDWVPAKDLKPGDLIRLNNHRGVTVPHTIETERGWLLGSLLGDGTFNRRDGKSDQGQLRFWGEGAEAMAQAALARIQAIGLTARSDFGVTHHKAANTWQVTCVALAEFAKSYGVVPAAKTITPAMEREDDSFMAGLLSGLFDADGCVVGCQDKGVSVRLSQSNLGTLEAVQRMLLRLGVVSSIYKNRREAGYRDLPDGKGGVGSYWCEAQHELSIASDNLFRFEDVVGFTDPEKVTRLDDLLSGYRRQPNRERFVARFAKGLVTPIGEEDVYDCSIPGLNAFDANGLYVHNCGEIGLRFTKSTDPWTGEGGSGSFCNLTAAVMRADDTRESMAEKIRVATWVGAIQATFTHFPYLRKGWAEICTEDRLLGVDITGQCDNPALSDNIETMSYFNWVARHTAAEASRVLGINMPAAITCGKPSGNSSQLVDCASGFHPRYARYYLRRVRIDGKDPLTALLRDSGVPMHKENGMGHLPDAEVPVWVVEFPVKSPDTAMVRDSETAVEMCERYLRVMQSWCGERGHNQSATIYVRDHEWEELGKWVYAHFDEITGLSFLPYDGGSYTLAPYEEITAEQYARASAMMPEVDFSLLTAYERDDRGNGATELACMGGSCEV